MVRKAFLVGINDYAPIGPSEHDLHGCVEDAKDMANTLVIAGFPATSIRLCTNSRATKKGIMDGLDWLIKGTEKGDSLVFYYSGHGSQVPNMDLGSDDVEIDRMDEILCPHDLDFARQIYVKDDDLRAIFKKLSAGVNLEVILDSCHSGTATREILDPLKPADGNGIINNGVIKRSRYIEPPIEYTFHHTYFPNLPKTRILKPRAGEKDIVIAPELNNTLWAACRDNQTSEETDINGVTRGVFTYYFCQVIRRSNASIIRESLHGLVNAALKREQIEQTPQLEVSSQTLLTNDIFKSETVRELPVEVKSTKKRKT